MLHQGNGYVQCAWMATSEAASMWQGLHVVDCIIAKSSAGCSSLGFSKEERMWRAGEERNKINTCTLAHWQVGRCGCLAAAGLRVAGRRVCLSTSESRAYYGQVFGGGSSATHLAMM